MDLDIDRATLMVRQGKGKKDRMVPISPRAIAWVEKYLVEARGALAVEPDDGTLFLTLDGHGFSLDRLTQLARGYVQTSGVAKQGACHLFRHTMATLMLEGGADIRYIQAMLGHADLSTTQIYTQVSIRALQAVHAATHPGSANTRRTSQAGHGLNDPDIVDGPPIAVVAGDSWLKVSPQQLLASLDQEREEENRPPTGSPEPTSGPTQ
jgi:integrase/recombinase XerD